MTVCDKNENEHVVWTGNEKMNKLHEVKNSVSKIDFAYESYERGRKMR